MVDAHYNALFHGFVGKKGELKGVPRLESIREEIRWFFKKAQKKGRKPFKPMFYRTNLEDHGMKVAWLAEELFPYAEKAFPGNFGLEKQRKALTLALIHDDLEIWTGDESSFVKEVTDQSELHQEEVEAIDELAKQYPETVNGFGYKDLLIEDIFRNTIVAQYIAYCDKIDGFGEALHELYAGNKVFIQDPNGKENKPANRYAEEWFGKREKKDDWTKLGFLFRYQHPFLNKPAVLSYEDLVKIAEEGKPHTEETIHKPTGYPMYDKWKEVILERGGKRGLELLVEQREFP